MSKRQPFKIKTIDHSLRDDYLAGNITAAEVAVRLYRAGWFNFIPLEDEALERIGITPECKEVTK